MPQGGARAGDEASNATRVDPRRPPGLTSRNEPLPRSPPLKILHLIAPAPAGGAESAVRSLTGGLRQAGRPVEVAALLPPHGSHPFVDRVRASGTPVHELRHRHRAYFAQARDLARHLRDGRVGLLHTHVYQADTIGFLARRRAGIPWVTTLHGFTGGDLKNRAYTKLGLLLIRRSDAVICVAENVRERAVAEGLDPRRLHLVPNGYLPAPALSRDEARRRLGLDPVRPAVGWIGRLSYEKGADLWLEALTRLAREDIRSVVVGDGPERRALEASARALGLGPERLRFAGQVDDAARLLEAFDAIVLSSRTEGTPMVVLEAMAAGVPIVSFAVGGIPQVLDDSSAFLAPAGDVEALAAAVKRLLGNPDDAVRRAEAARTVFEARYSVGPAVARHAAIYDMIAAARHRGGSEHASEPSPSGARR